jgi:hypothetical protein
MAGNGKLQNSLLCMNQVRRCSSLKIATVPVFIHYGNGKLCLPVYHSKNLYYT